MPALTPALKKVLPISLGIACAASQAAETGNSFIDDAKLNGKVRTVYYDIEDTYDKDKGKKPYKSGAWTGGLQVNLSSGYVGDVVAIGGSFYGVAKIDYDEKEYKDSYQLLDKDNKGFSKLGQAWVDVKMGDEKDDFSGHLKIGRQMIYTGLISSSGSRSVPSTWQGVNFESRFMDTEFKAAYVNEMSLRNEADFNKLVNFEDPGKQIDFVMGGELAHTFRIDRSQNLKLVYRNAFSKDFLQAHNGEVKWTKSLSDDVSVRLGGLYYYTKEDGNLWTGTAWGKKSFDNDATAANLNTGLTIGGWDFEAAVSTYRADAKIAAPKISDGKRYAAPSVYYYDFGKNTHGIWGMPTGGFAEDMIYDGETVWKLGVSYDFSTLGAKGLKLGYAYNYGKGMEVTNVRGQKIEVAENEHDVFIKYAFPQAPLKGLEFKLEYGMYRNDEELREAIGKEENDLRVWLDYNFSLL